MPIAIRRIGLLAAAVVATGWATSAHALTCSASVTNLAFGSNVDLLPGTAVDATATISLSCSNFDLLLFIQQPARLCLSIGNGSGGRDSTGRYMSGSSTTLAYQLYTDSSRTTVWGDATLGFGTVPTVDLTAASPSTTRTIYGRILAGQAAKPADTYTSNFTTADTDFVYGSNTLNIIACNGLAITVAHLHPTFVVSATVPKTCTLSTTNIDFGSYGVLNTTRTSNGQLLLRCSSGAAYQVGLGNGQNSTGPLLRRMKKGSEYITYGLYADAGYSTAWGDIGASPVGGTGTGADQALTVYGTVPSQTTPSPGVYQDTIVVTITY